MWKTQSFTKGQRNQTKVAVGQLLGVMLEDSDSDFLDEAKTEAEQEVETAEVAAWTKMLEIIPEEQY